jgi:hypothetical protein
MLPRCLTFALLASAAAGCAFPPAGDLPPPVTAADVETAKARFPDASEGALNAGRDLFAARCNGCHHYPDVSKIEDGRWPEILSRMGKKASLDDAQTHAVLSFILVARSEPATSQVAPGR